MTLAETAPRLAPALEPRYYRDPEIAELEEERIFARSWQLVAHVAQLPNPGDYLTGTRRLAAGARAARRGRRSSAPSATSAATAARAS